VATRSPARPSAEWQLALYRTLNAEKRPSRQYRCRARLRLDAHNYLEDGTDGPSMPSPSNLGQTERVESAGEGSRSRKAMERDRLLERISVDPRVCFGKPCIRGHRIWVSLVLDLLAAGLSVEDVLEEYPQLSREDVLACVAYGAEMSRERFVDVPLERLA
jgi:uncharacterized protein (DUF433 family)